MSGSSGMGRLGDSEPLPPVQAITPLQQMVSSCTGALLTSFMVTPLDVVKIRLQSQQQTFKQGSCFIYHNGLMDCLCMCSHCSDNGKVQLKPWYNQPGRFSGTVQKIQSCQLHGTKASMYLKLLSEGACLAGSASTPFPRPRVQFKGTLDAFVKIAKYEGLSSLWSGLPPTLVMSVPATVFYFTSYDHLKYYMGFREKDPSTKYLPLLAGSIARVGTVILISPLELVRTKMQSQQLSYRELGTAVRVSIQHGGLASLMRGVGPTLLRDVPFSAIYWFCYEYVKAFQLQQHGNKEVMFSQSFIAGATAGSIAALLTLPFDVVKTHRQIQLGQAELMKENRITSTYSVMTQLYRQQGLKSLFVGLVPRLSKVAPACAIMISSYEYFKKFFRHRNAMKAQESVKDWT